MATITYKNYLLNRSGTLHAVQELLSGTRLALSRVEGMQKPVGCLNDAYPFDNIFFVRAGRGNMGCGLLLK